MAFDEYDDSDEEETDDMPAAKADENVPTTISITGLDIGALEDRIANRVIREITGRVLSDHDKRIANAIEASVDTAVRAIVERQLDAQICEVIANGWEVHTPYGGKTGKKVTLSERILEYLNELVDQDGRPSSYGGQTRYRRIFTEMVNKTFNKELAKVVEEFRVEAKKVLDDEFKGRLTKALKEIFSVR